MACTRHNERAAPRGARGWLCDVGIFDALGTCASRAQIVVLVGPARPEQIVAHLPEPLGKGRRDRRVLRSVLAIRGGKR
jgi:hypothetical protein